MQENEEKKTIFREKAMEKLASSEESDKLLVVMTPLGWLSLWCLFALIIAAIIWSIFGQIPVTVQGKGIILTSRGLFTITAPADGIITEVPVKLGDWVAKDHLIAKLEKGQEIKSREDGKILEIYVHPGDFVKEGDTIAWAQYPLEKGDRYICYGFYSVEDGEKISEGMEAKLGLENVDISKVGYLLGQVAFVSQFPVTERSMLGALQNPSIVKLLRDQHSSVIRTEIELQRDERAPSGYLWTTKNVPAGYIVAGTICDVTIVTDVKAPITYLLPILAKNPKKNQTINPDVFPDNPNLSFGFKPLRFKEHFDETSRQPNEAIAVGSIAREERSVWREASRNGFEYQSLKPKAEVLKR